MSGLTIQKKVHFGKGRRSKKELRSGHEPTPRPPRVPRVAKLMALAIKFDRLIRDGTVADYSELARLGHVTRARMTQIMNLLNLAPDIQEAILFLPQVEQGRDAVTERDLRALVVEMDWRKQRRLWGRMLKKRRISVGADVLDQSVLDH